MENLKAELNTSLNEQGERDLTGTQVGNKFGLDVNIIGGSSGGGGGAGDASAANQLTQITAANSTNTKLDTLEAKSPQALATVIPRTQMAQDASFHTYNIAPLDFVRLRTTINGQSVKELSISPLTDDTTSTIINNNLVPIPHELNFELSLSQRTQGHVFFNEMVENPLVADTVEEWSLASITQASSTLTLVLQTAATSVNVGDWVTIYGVTNDNRLNYNNLVVITVSVDKKTITSTMSNDITIPAITVGPFTNVGTMRRIPLIPGAKNGYSFRYSGTSSTGYAFANKSDSQLQVSGTLNGSHTLTTASSAPVYTAQGTGQYDVKASTRTRVNIDENRLVFYDSPVDSLSTMTARLLRTTVDPLRSVNYNNRIRAYVPKDITRPVAKIISSVKSGTTTATITTDAPHGLINGQFISLYGQRDAVNFPQTASVQVGSVLNLTQFQVVQGGAVTATTYSGAVISLNGGIAQPGLQALNVSTVSRDADSLVTVVGSGSWTFLIGDYVNLYGVRDDGASGADLGLDGCYEVISLVTTTVVLKPVYDSLTGLPMAPIGGILTTKNAGGIIITRPTLRLYDVLVEKYVLQRVIIDGQGTTDFTKGVPTFSLGGTYNVVQSTAAAASATDGSGGWLIRPAIVGISDIVSAAITTTTTSAAVSNALGNSFQITVAVTAVTGTTPTLDLRIEESYDAGTNWVTLYEFQRITATGSFNSPVLRATGRNIRYVRTIAGTTPSFTMSLARTVLPFLNAEPQRRIMDRSIVLTTLNSTTPVLFQGSANNVQLVVNVGAITTTAPAIQLEGSEDGINFYTIGTPLTAVANSTVEFTAIDKSSTYTRARVSTAGVGVTAGYISIKAWS